MKKINKEVKQDFKSLTKLLNANKICQNISKTKAILFKLARKEKDTPLKLKLTWKRLCPVNSVKYLSIKFDEILNWKQQISHLAIRLNRANVILSKLRHLSTGKLSTQYIMQYLNLIHNAFLLLGHKIKIQLKDFLFSKKNSYNFYSKNPAF